MNVAVWSNSGLADRYLTGVGQHTLQMLCGLQQLPEVDLLHVRPHASAMREDSAAALSGLPSVELPWSGRTISAAWALVGRPLLNQWCPRADWVYCPRELYPAPGRCRYALTVHDLWPLDRGSVGLKTWLKWRWLLGRALKRANLVLTVSAYTAGRVQHYFGTSSSKIRVVGNGATPDFYCVKPELIFSTAPELAGRTYAITVGGLTHKKGGDYFLALAKVLAQERPELRLLLVGPIDPGFSSQSLPDNVIHLRRGLSGAELARLVAGAAFALSLSRYEGFGITLIEAMAAGTPVVASDIPAHQEVASGAALLIDPTDTKALSCAAGQLLDDNSSADRLRSAGRERARHYTWEKAVGRLYSALAEFSE